MIVAEGLGKSFGRKVLDGVSFEVPAGQVLGYLGANGAGKTTTIRILTGQLATGQGRATIAGFDIAKQPAEAKRLLGCVPEQLALYDQLTPREYLDFVGALYRLPDTDTRKRADEFLEFFDLSDRANSRMATFSKGMQKKVVLAAALLHRPKALFLDEPLDGLDANSALQLKELIGRLARSGVAVFYSSHVLDVVEKVCDRVIILHESRIALDEPMDTLRAEGLEKRFSKLTSTRDPRARAEEFHQRLNEG